ncbi:RhoGAP-domain-containing protein [Sodiomyces alkalinus F11]|uniref:RhoGAP-domain-containing protein n=1 Tax=Sodiomyces alkalinus (strain CBS 110278 / VKM F-3762 / F11) TaxID=1314773 RepID=A0A3N2PRS9_SODAK|nr:RhoGAP-domain-containing protein [Sodiomyces alkalinus F11]ROT37222.1 RhoGAP-domain-containing protein [Sodiomyces alkalinus F11]
MTYIHSWSSTVSLVPRHPNPLAFAVSTCTTRFVSLPWYHSADLLSHHSRRATRRPIPSPLSLAAAVSPASPTLSSRSDISPATTPHHSGRSIPQSPTYSGEGPRSPREKLDELLAAEKTFYQSNTSAVSTSTPEAGASRSIANHPPTNGGRAVSDAVATPAPTKGLPKSQTVPNMAGPTPATRGEPGTGAPRNSSIDSSISAATSSSNYRKGSQSSQVEMPDIASLIKTAGSPEAVIQYLLKEKQSQSQQNSQLWRLVDKQRAMILGLNKDLERALKDKEKYRKKLKEVIAVPQMAKAAESQPKPATSEPVLGRPIPKVDISGPDDRHVAPDSPSLELDSQKHSPIDMAMAPYPITPPADRIDNGPPSAVGDMLDPSHMMPKPQEHAYDKFDHEAEENAADAARHEEKERQIRELPINLSLPPSRSLPSQPPKGPPPKPPVAPPALAATEATPKPDKDIAQFPNPPPRKPPPAPLQLHKSKTPTPEEGDTDSDFDDILEVDEILDDRRGRRRTREEDERARKVSAKKETEMRSLSKKSKSQSQKGTPTVAEAPQLPAEALALPASPRQFPQQFATYQNGAASLAGVLNGDRLGAPKLGQPLTPGLPLSPRPGGGPRGFVTEEYPDLLLPPNAIPSIQVRVASSRMKPSRASVLSLTQLEEDPVFTLAVFSRADRGELWRVEKDLASLSKLDQKLKQCPSFTTKAPDRALFTGHAPAKLDARRQALDRYLEELLETPLDLSTALEFCKYLSTNVVPPNADEEGRPEVGADSPTARARFFVLDGPRLRYFEAPGGAHLGTIKLPHAQIGKQSQNNENQPPGPGAPSTEDFDNQYRHAFLILEPKKKDSSSYLKHVLCAESDTERDRWVEALLKWIDYREPGEEDAPGPAHDRQNSEGSEPTGAKKKKGKGNQAQGDLPQSARPKTSSGMPDNSDMPHSPIVISGPKDMQVISDSAAWGNKIGLSVPSYEEKKQRKRSFFGSSADGQDTLFGHEGSASSTPPQGGYHGPVRQVFGAQLAEAVRYNAPQDVAVPLPSVVYRCIQYLDANNASLEEGIFRLSGSNVVIKQLKERFNTEGDINLVTDEMYYDIHAVASLLKLYLRELPTTILTRDLHMDFLTVTEMTDRREKISALSDLVQRLPLANATLLKYLIAFLIKIINNADINKMTVRNVGIVFSPTLNIPAPVFAMFLQNYEPIFGVPPEEYELPSGSGESVSTYEAPSPILPAPGRPYDPQRPGTSGQSQSPHRQRLLESVTGQGRAGGVTPPLLQHMNAARASPTPSQNFSMHRGISYEPQQYANHGPGGGAGYDQPIYPSGYQDGSNGGGAPSYESGYKNTKRRESAMYGVGMLAASHPNQGSRSRLREETRY